jgi:hypothetical protein
MVLNIRIAAVLSALAVLPACIPIDHYASHAQPHWGQQAWQSVHHGHGGGWQPGWTQRWDDTAHDGWSSGWHRPVMLQPRGPGWGSPWRQGWQGW